VAKVISINQAPRRKSILNKGNCPKSLILGAAWWV
jgi:hypothetical protein